MTNQTPNTPELRESDLSRMRINELRERARDQGITDFETLRKDELVAAISKRAREAHRAGRAPEQSGDNRRAPAAGNETPDTPDLSETELRAMHVGELRERARDEGVSADDLRKDELVSAISKRHH